MSSSSKKMVVPGGAEEYISECPKEIQAKLKLIRSAILEIAPDAIETVSYFGIPGYCYEGYDYNGMFAWFSYKNRTYDFMSVLQLQRTTSRSLVAARSQQAS